MSKSCLPRFYGDDCEKYCQYPFFGNQCKEKCECREKVCHHLNGCPPVGKRNLQTLPIKSDPSCDKTISKNDICFCF